MQYSPRDILRSYQDPNLQLQRIISHTEESKKEFDKVMAEAKKATNEALEFLKEIRHERT